MPSTIVGVLLERHRDHIVLANGTQIFLDEGVPTNPLPIGATLTILCTPQGDKKLAHYIRVNPDGVLDALEALVAGSDYPLPRQIGADRIRLTLASLADRLGEPSERCNLEQRNPKGFDTRRVFSPEVVDDTGLEPVTPGM